MPSISIPRALTDMRVLSPQMDLSERDVERGMRMLVWEGASTMGFGSILASGFLTAYALMLGANNLQVGILAAVPFLMQPLQLVQTPIVERLRRRKLLAIIASTAGQGVWIPIALIPILLDVPGAASVSALLGLLALRALLGTTMMVNRDSWTRDLVPRNFLASFASRRLTYATSAAIVVGLGSSFFVDFWRVRSSPEYEAFGYTIALAAGAIFIGMASPVFMALAPEPLMRRSVGPPVSLVRMVAMPFQDSNYRRLMTFLFMRGFTTNLAVPFFAVYMLQRIGLPLSAVMGFTVLGQVSNLLFLRVWGPMADRLGNKVVLSVCGSLLSLVTLCWTFTTMPERHAFTLPLLAVLYIFFGIATAGINVAMGTIGMKLAPEGTATPYLAAASLSASLGAGISPLLGGRFADFFSVHAFSINVEWVAPSRIVELPAFSLTGYDFLFAVAFLVGILTLSSLSAVREDGESSREVALEELMANSSGAARVINSVPGLSLAVHIPYNYLRNIPGVDVMVGVSAYQIASSTHAAVVAARRSMSSAERVAQGVSGVLAEATRNMERLGDEGARLALHSARGAMRAAREAEQDVENIARGAIIGAVSAVGGSVIDPAKLLENIVHGIVLGAYETDGDVFLAAQSAIEAARESASDLGIDEEEATTQAVEGVMEAAREMDADVQAELRSAISAIEGGSVNES